MEIVTSNLVEAVQGVILAFEKAACENKLSIQDLADKANSSYTTIREIKKGVLKSLSVKKALEISRRLNGPQTIEELLSTGKEDEVDVDEISRKYSHLFDYNILPHALYELFGNKKFSKILWAAFSTKHISKDEIELRWGQEGIDKLNYLLEVGLVKDDHGTIVGVTSSAGGAPSSAIKELQVGVTEYKPKNQRDEMNWVSFQTNSVNEKFVKEFREELRGMFRKFNKKVNDINYQGDRQMFFGMIFDTYLENLDKNKEVQ